MKNNTVRVHRNGGKKAPSSQAQMRNGTTPRRKTDSPESKPTMQVVFFKPDTAFSHTPECRVAAQIEIPASRFAEVKAAALASQPSSQAKTGNYEVIQRPVNYNQVLEFIDDFQRLEFSRDEVVGLLALGASLLRLMAKDDASSKVADNYAELVPEAKYKMGIACNSIHQTVFNIEPRVDDPWRTSAEIEAGD